MTAYYKNKAVGQLDKVLHNGKEYTDTQLKWLIANYGDKLPKDKGSKK